MKISLTTFRSAAKRNAAASNELIFRVAIAAFLVISIALLWWVFCRTYTPRVRQSHELAASISRLSAEVEQLDHDWPKADIERLTNRFAIAQSLLFANAAALDHWAADLKEQSAPSDFALTADFGSAAVQNGGGWKFMAVPAVVTFDVQAGRTAPGRLTPYQQLLQISQRVAAQDKRVDLTELTVQGGTSSVSHAVLGFNLWTNAEATLK